MITSKLKHMTKHTTGNGQPHQPQLTEQMTLFPEEKPGRNLEKLKMKMLLKAFYKQADEAIALRKAS